MVFRYSLREMLFGPKVSFAEVVDIEWRAVNEGWYEVLGVLLEGRRTLRGQRFLLAGIRDGFVDVVVYDVESHPSR